MEMSYPRRRTRVVRVGDLGVGGDEPVRVQSMITSPTLKTGACVNEIVTLYQAGCEIVRITAETPEQARNIANIKQQLALLSCPVPLVADVHHNGTKIAVEVAQHVDKVRVNPGLFVFRKPRGGDVEWTEADHAAEREAVEKALLPVIRACQRRDIAMRIGVNHGSLGERMTVTYGDTPEGMVQSALEYIRICEEHGYRNLIISLKASRVQVMLAANRLMAQRLDELGMDYPMHLGVTEAGNGDYAKIKSTLGIGTLLAEGLGDTIRVSLTEDSVHELPVCYDILQGLGLRRTKVEFIACPSCGRTKFEIQTVLEEVQQATQHLPGIDIAVMGCIVNGPGEMADADYGYVGKGGGKIALYRGHEEVKGGIPQERGVEELIALLKADGVWQDPPPHTDGPAPEEAELEPVPGD
jgi:(E)-4-hydroxy-3-methylbut-2-enyl-diphosphate synthase